MKWEDVHHTPRLGGVEIDPSRREVRGGRHFGRHLFPFRAGQEVEDTGRRPMIFDLDIPLFDGVDPNAYPGKLEQLRELFDSPETQGELEYVDPLLGPIQVKVADWDFSEGAEDRNGGFLRVVLEENSTDAFLASDIGRLDPRADAEVQAVAVDAGLSDVGLDEGELVTAWADAGVPLTGIEVQFEAGSLFLHIVDTFFETIEAAALAADEVAAVLDAHRLRIDRLLAFDPVREVRGWSIWHSAVGLSGSMTRAAESAFESQPPVVLWPVPRRMSHFEISMSLYRTPNRAREISRRNPVRNPLFYPEGMQLRVLAS